MNVKYKVENNIPVQRRSMKNYNKNKLIAELKKWDWSDINHNTETNLVNHRITENITSVLDRICPKVTVKNNLKHENFLTDETRELMRLRAECRRQASGSRNSAKWLEYKK